MILFAQAAHDPQVGEISTATFILAIVAIAVLFVGFFFWLIFRQVARSRELSHLERMKALELGKPIEPSDTETSQSKYLHNAFWICFWIGAGVPMAATSAASSVMIQAHLQDFSIILAIWICVVVISVPSVICATVLMFSSQHWSKKDVYSSGNGKAV